MKELMYALKTLRSRVYFTYRHTVRSGKVSGVSYYWRLSKEIGV